MAHSTRNKQLISNTDCLLSEQALQFRALVENSSNFLNTCDGGDAGSPDSPSIWLFGLEPGWSIGDQQSDEAGNGNAEDKLRRYSVEMQMEWPFNRNAFKLLAALKGYAPEDYIEFAMRDHPFERGYSGYFKGNLFSAACNNVGVWSNEHRLETGFADKSDYQAWMRAIRFPIVKAWINKCRPSLIICAGLTHLHDFLMVTGTAEVPEPHFFRVNGHSKRVHVTSTGIVPVAVIPHLSGGVHGLNSFQAISETAKYIAHALPGLRL
jgi:hypothetical protein